MSFDRSKMLLAFAFIGFTVGTVTYFFFDWIIKNSAFGVLYLPIPVFAPWFMSGMAGSLLSVAAIYVAARYSAKK